MLVNIDINDEKRFTSNQGPKIGWNYPDALFVGKGGMSNTEYRTMFALWCAVKSPLMLGSGLSKVDITSEAFEVKSNYILVPILQIGIGINNRFFTNFMTN
jgi:alpha-galactosidase